MQTSKLSSNTAEIRTNKQYVDAPRHRGIWRVNDCSFQDELFTFFWTGIEWNASKS